jgi:hypothetical protein
MNLRELLKKDFGIDFPISGGFGNSRETAITIHRGEPNDYVSVEYGILRCLGMGRRIEWKLLGQMLIKHEGRMMEQMKIETVQLTDDERITQVENYYFDLSECFGPRSEEHKD